MKLSTRYQAQSRFLPGSPAAGYYNDLRGFARRNGSLLESEWLVRRRGHVQPGPNIVTIAQIGLGAWQLSADDPRWRPVVVRAANWLTERMDPGGLLPYDFPMPHTYKLEPPWPSAMAQGQAASLLVRAGYMLEDPTLLHAAGRAILSLVQSDSRLVAATAEGPVLQEYPTDPPAHVLNGWIFSLWGLFDVATLDGSIGVHAQEAFHQGVQALARRLPLYELPGGWSRYDLFPHPRVNVASPFYHHLHGQLLFAMAQIQPRDAFLPTAQAWDRSASNPAAIAAAVLRKLQFRRVVKKRHR